MRPESTQPVTLPTMAWGTPTAARRALLIHGLAGSAGTWWRVADELAARGFYAVAPDLRGHGAAPCALDYRLESYVADLAQLDDGWDVVVGQSSGGLLAISRALGTEEFARRLVLLDPILDVADASYDQVARAIIQTVQQPSEPRAYVRAHPDCHPGDAWALAQATASVSPFAVEKTLADNRPWHYLDLLDAITVPTLILGADPAHHPVTTLDMVQPYLDRNPVLSFQVAAGCGHAIYRDDPRLVVAQTCSEPSLPGSVR